VLLASASGRAGGISLEEGQQPQPVAEDAKELTAMHPPALLLSENKVRAVCGTILHPEPHCLQLIGQRLTSVATERPARLQGTLQAN